MLAINTKYIRNTNLHYAAGAADNSLQQHVNSGHKSPDEKSHIDEKG